MADIWIVVCEATQDDGSQTSVAVGFTDKKDAMREAYQELCDGPHRVMRLEMIK